MSKEEKKAVVYVDHRERNAAVLNILLNNSVLVRMKELKVGDFIVSERVAIERKTANDFINSVIDQRIFRQAEELIDNYENPMIILEGNPLEEPRNVHKNALRGAMSSLMIDYGIPIIQTKNPEETAEFISFLAKREQLHEKKVTRLRGEKRKMTDEQQMQFIVESLPSVGPTLAKNLLKHFGNVENVFSASEEQLTAVDKIGGKKAKQIRTLITKIYP